MLIRSKKERKGRLNFENYAHLEPASLIWQQRLLWEVFALDLLTILELRKDATVLLVKKYYTNPEDVCMALGDGKHLSSWDKNKSRWLYLWLRMWVSLALLVLDTGDKSCMQTAWGFVLLPFQPPCKLLA
jgi:hypothetical protein